MQKGKGRVLEWAVSFSCHEVDVGNAFGMVYCTGCLSASMYGASCHDSTGQFLAYRIGFWFSGHEAVTILDEVIWPQLLPWSSRCVLFGFAAWGWLNGCEC
jgi:hypothetical protein